MIKRKVVLLSVQLSLLLILGVAVAAFVLNPKLSRFVIATLTQGIQSLPLTKPKNDLYLTGILFSGGSVRNEMAEASRAMTVTCPYKAIPDHLYSEEYRRDVLLYPAKSEGESSQKTPYLISTNEKVSLDKAGGTLEQKFQVPDYLPKGTYTGEIRIQKAGDNTTAGTCPFSIIVNAQSSLTLEVKRLVSQEASHPSLKSTALVPVVKPEDTNLAFEVLSNQTITVRPQLLVTDLVTSKPILQRNGTSVNLVANSLQTVEIPVTEFNKNGAYLVQLSLLNQSNSVITQSGVYPVFFGEPVKLAMVSESAGITNSFRGRVEYNPKVPAATDQLELYTVLRDKQGYDCGEQTYSLEESWPATLEVSNAKLCPSFNAFVYLRLKKLHTIVDFYLLRR